MVPVWAPVGVVIAVSMMAIRMACRFLNRPMVWPRLLRASHMWRPVSVVRGVFAVAAGVVSMPGDRGWPEPVAVPQRELYRSVPDVQLGANIGVGLAGQGDK